jgi:hypothetical protein
VSTAIWVALGFLLLVVVCGTFWVGFHALNAWREVRRLPGGILAEMTELNQRLALLEGRMTAVEQQVADLQSSVDRLSVSLARARVLAGALGEVRSAVDSVRSFIPTK